MSNEPAIFIADFKNQLIREKVMMEKPELKDKTVWPYLSGNQRWDLLNDEMTEYNAHVASRRSFSYPVKKEQDGKELSFRVEKRLLSHKEAISDNILTNSKTEFIEIAIPIDNIGQKDRQYEEGLPEQSERFKMPTDKQLINTAILFNDGIIDHKKLADMVGMCEFVINRLYENGNILTPSSEEK